MPISQIVSESETFSESGIESEVPWNEAYNVYYQNVLAKCTHLVDPEMNYDFSHASYLTPHILAIKSLEKLGITPDKVSNALYVAASYGFGPKAFALAGYPILSTDINSKAVDIANSCGVPAKVMSAYSLEFERNELDMVASRDFLRDDYLLEYQLEQAIYEQWRVLKPGGIILHYSITKSIVSNLDRQMDLIESIGFSKVYKVPFATGNNSYRTEVVILQK